MVKGMKIAKGKKSAAKKKPVMKSAMITVMKVTIKAAKISGKGKKFQVFNGTKLSTTGGLRKENLVKNIRGKVVSRMRRKKPTGLTWFKAMAKARKQLKITGSQAIGGETQKGLEFLNLTRKIQEKLKAKLARFQYFLSSSLCDIAITSYAHF